MSVKPIHVLGTFALTLVGAIASFVLTTVLMDQVPDAVLVGVTTLVSAAVLISLRLVGLPAHVRTTPLRSTLLAGAGGVTAFALAPMIALSQRATDAPSGSETLFFTTAVWGLLAVIAGALVLRERHGVLAACGAALSLAGAASLLANWERPSSFSPFAKFPVQETWMIVAGVVFVIGTIALMRASREQGAGYVASVAAGAAGLVAVPWAALGVLEHWPSLARLSTEFILLGAAHAAFIAGWSAIAQSHGLARAGSALLWVPVGVTALFAVERATAVFGPLPFQVPGVIAGAAVCTAGAVAVWLSGRGDERSVASEKPQVRVSALLAWIALAAALWSLLRPALTASAVGMLGEGFSATWTQLGFESAVGWLAVTAAITLLGSIYAYREGRSAIAWGSAAFAALIAAGASRFLLDTTLHTWNRWVPATVQQTYGTEYARFGTSAVVEPVRVAAFALVVVSAALFLAAATAGHRQSLRVEHEET